VILFATAFKLVVEYAIIRFVDNRRYTLSLRLFRQYLNQPYSYFLDQNTGELSKNILVEVDQVINNLMRPMMQVFARGVRVHSLVAA
jgi:ATP-binding cassette, subfamily B, bacterial PglK